MIRLYDVADIKAKLDAVKAQCDSLSAQAAADKAADTKECRELISDPDTTEELPKSDSEE